MKKLFVSILAITLISCGEKEVDFSQISLRNGIAYKANQNTPFTGIVTKKLANEQIVLSGSYKDGKKNGEWLEYFDNGQLRLQEDYLAGNLDGLSVRYLNNGNLKHSKKYKKNILDGPFIENYGNGNPKVKANYKNGIIQGKYESFYSNGNRELSYTYDNSNYDKDYIEFNDDGSVHRQIFYENGASKNKGTWKKYWKRNNPVKQSGLEYSTISFDKNGKPKTSAKFFYINGNLKSETEYSSIEPNVRNGKSIHYYPNGQVKSSLNYKNNKLNGEAISYYNQLNKYGENNIMQKVNYKNGELDGNFEYWNGFNWQASEHILVKYKVNQNMRNNSWWKVEGNCKNGKFDGLFKLWWRYPTNKRKEPFNMPLYIKHIWSNGRLISNGFDSKGGRNLIYDKQGDLTTLEERNKLISKML
jgi:antitoxin component YwqK of YwqJK toxin-antitoxin module